MQTKIGPLPSSKSASVFSSFTPGAGCTADNSSTSLGPSALYTDTSGFQFLERPAYNRSWWAQGQLWPSEYSKRLLSCGHLLARRTAAPDSFAAFPGWDFSFSGGCDASGEPGGIMSQSFQRPMGVGLQANTTVMQMIHRREISPGDPRGNDSVVMDDAFVASFSDLTADVPGYLLSRQVRPVGLDTPASGCEGNTAMRFSSDTRRSLLDSSSTPSPCTPPCCQPSEPTLGLLVQLRRLSRFHARSTCTLSFAATCGTLTRPSLLGLVAPSAVRTACASSSSLELWARRRSISPAGCGVQRCPT